jgi:hypothetical protein
MLALKAILARNQHSQLRDGKQIHASNSKLQKKRVVPVLIGPLTDFDRDARALRNYPIERQSRGSGLKITIEQRANLVELFRG